MPRKPDKRIEQAKQMFLNGFKLVEIASRLELPEGTVRRWKSTHKWDSERSDKNNERSDKVKISKRSGNPNPQNQFSNRNTASTLHGLRSKFIHQEQVEIMDALKGTDPADRLWLQLEIVYSSIIRMQKVMWVDDANDHLSQVSGEGESTQYKVIYSFERYEAYIKAQTRAVAEYRNLEKQFLAIAHEADERRLKIGIMQADLDRKQEELKVIRGEDDGDSEAVAQYNQATEPEAEIVAEMFKGDGET